MAANNINDINDHCLIEIFKYLSTSDWMTLCVTTKRFREIVINHVVKQEMVVYDGDTRILKTLGKTMTKLSYLGGYMKDFLETLLNYLTPGALTHIELRDFQDDSPTVDEGLVAQAAKYLENVNTLRCCDGTTMNEWLIPFPTHHIHSLHLELANGNDFTLHPHSFPKLLKCTILFDRPHSPNERMINALSDFIKTKTNLKEFWYLGWQNEMIFKTIAENCANITSLGKIEIKCDGVASRWNVLKRCAHLHTIAIGVEVFNHQEFANIVDVMSTLSQLKALSIQFENDDRIECDAFCNEIISFVKWSNSRKKIDISEYMQLYIDVDIDVNLAQQLCYIISTTFNVKTLILERYEYPERDLKCLSSIVRNMHNLESFYFVDDSIYNEQTPLTLWSNLMMEKISLNNQFRTAKILTIFVDEKCEEKLKNVLAGSLYDPQIIALSSHSRSPRQPNHLWSSLL